MRFAEVQSKHSLTFLLLIMGAFTASPSLGEDRMVKLIDVRNASDVDNTAHYIVICARPAELTLEEAKKLPVYSPGHVWVLFAKEDPKKQASVIDKSYGFWPDGEAKLIDSVPGQLVNNLIDPDEQKEQSKLTHRIILRVSESQYASALSVAVGWNKKPPKYNTLAVNCTHFSMAILDALSLSIPYRKAELPTNYLERAASELARKYGPAR